MIFRRRVRISRIAKEFRRFLSPEFLAAEGSLVEVAEFLQRALGCGYVGVIVEDDLYGSKKLGLEEMELVEIEMLPPAEGMWLNASGVAETMEKYRFAGVLELRGVEGQRVGQVLLGEVTDEFLQQNRIEIEMTVRLLSMVVEELAGSGIARRRK